MTTTVLKPDLEGFAHLHAALLRAQSIPGEHGHLARMVTRMENGDLRTTKCSSLIHDDRTLRLIGDLSYGHRTCDRDLWLNLSSMVSQSPGWQVTLAMRGVHMPSYAEALAQADQLLRA